MNDTTKGLLLLFFLPALLAVGSSLFERWQGEGSTGAAFVKVFDFILYPYFVHLCNTVGILRFGGSVGPVSDVFSDGLSLVSNLVGLFAFWIFKPKPLRVPKILATSVPEILATLN